MADDPKNNKVKMAKDGGKNDQPAAIIAQLKAELQAEIDGLKDQVNQLDGKYRRALADYQNLERQTNEYQQRFVKIATESFVQELVQPYGHLKLAAKHLQDKGLDMVVAQFKGVFEAQGLKEIEPLGQDFDPVSMEAIETREGEKGKVVAVHECGFELNGIVIKPAKVAVGK